MRRTIGELKRKFVHSDAKHTLQRVPLLLDQQSQARRARLATKDFTIVSNDCWGAEVYKDMNLPFGTPLIGTFLLAPDFMRLVADCARILRTPLAFAPESRYEEVRLLKAEEHDFPTGLLDDGRVEVQFQHYESVEEAAAKWRKRVERIVDDRLFFKLSGDKNEFTDEHYREFDAAPLRHKIALSREPHPELTSVVHVPDWTRDGKLMYERSIRQFDVVAWLNDV